MRRENGGDTGPLGVEAGVVRETVPKIDVGNRKRNTLGGRSGGSGCEFGWRDLRYLPVLVWMREWRVGWRWCDVAFRNIVGGMECVCARGDRHGKWES